MEVAFSRELQQETRRNLDERNEHVSDDKNEEFINHVKVDQYCSLRKWKGENHTDEGEEDHHRQYDVSNVIRPFDGLLDGVASSTRALGEDPSCR
jgi:hypothetical protein